MPVSCQTETKRSSIEESNFNTGGAGGNSNATVLYAGLLQKKPSLDKHGQESQLGTTRNWETLYFELVAVTHVIFRTTRLPEAAGDVMRASCSLQLGPVADEFVKVKAVSIFFRYFDAAHVGARQRGELKLRSNVTIAASNAEPACGINIVFGNGRALKVPRGVFPIFSSSFATF